MIEQTGLVRWLVTVLSMLNEVPIETREVTPRGSKRVGDHFRRELPFSVVTLRIPRVKSRANYVARKIASGGRKKRHEVISHWRTYLSDAPCPVVVGENGVSSRGCEWTYEEERPAHRTCSKCETFSVLIREHERGDESLGWVTKSYRLRAEKEKRSEEG